VIPSAVAPQLLLQLHHFIHFDSENVTEQQPTASYMMVDPKNDETGDQKDRQPTSFLPLLFLVLMTRTSESYSRALHQRSLWFNFLLVIIAKIAFLSFLVSMKKKREKKGYRFYPKR